LAAARWGSISLKNGNDETLDARRLEFRLQAGQDRVNAELRIWLFPIFHEQQETIYCGVSKMMTTVSLKDALLDSAKEVFETMVFMTMEESADGAASLGDTTLLGSITFKGHLEGCLGVCCDEACARTIAANMLGMLSAEELSESDVSDAIGEIANMVMGAVKARIQNEVGSVEVSIPSVVQGRELKNSLGDGSGQVKVLVNIEEQYLARFSLQYREGKNS